MTNDKLNLPAAEEIELDSVTIKRFLKKSEKYQKKISETQDRINRALSPTQTGRTPKLTEGKSNFLLTERNDILEKLINTCNILGALASQNLIYFSDFFTTNRLTLSLPIHPSHESEPSKNLSPPNLLETDLNPNHSEETAGAHTKYATFSFPAGAQNQSTQPSFQDRPETSSPLPLYTYSNTSLPIEDISTSISPHILTSLKQERIVSPTAGKIVKRKATIKVPKRSRSLSTDKKNTCIDSFHTKKYAESKSATQSFFTT